MSDSYQTQSSLTRITSISEAVASLSTTQIAAAILEKERSRIHRSASNHMQKALLTSPKSTKTPSLSESMLRSLKIIRRTTRDSLTIPSNSLSSSSNKSPISCENLGQNRITRTRSESNRSRRTYFSNQILNDNSCCIRLQDDCDSSASYSVTPQAMKKREQRVKTVRNNRSLSGNSTSHQHQLNDVNKNKEQIQSSPMKVIQVPARKVKLLSDYVKCNRKFDQSQKSSFSSLKSQIGIAADTTTTTTTRASTAKSSQKGFASKSSTNKILKIDFTISSSDDDLSVSESSISVCKGIDDSKPSEQLLLKKITSDFQGEDSLDQQSMSGIFRNKPKIIEQNRAISNEPKPNQFKRRMTTPNMNFHALLSHEAPSSLQQSPKTTRTKSSGFAKIAQSKIVGRGLFGLLSSLSEKKKKEPEVPPSVPLSFTKLEEGISIQEKARDPYLRDNVPLWIRQRPDFFKMCLGNSLKDKLSIPSICMKPGQERTTDDLKKLRNYLTRVKHFETMSEEFSYYFCMHFRTQVFWPGELVVKAGSEASSMFVIYEGELTERVTPGKSSASDRVLKQFQLHHREALQSRKSIMLQRDLVNSSKTKACILLVIDRKEYRKLLEERQNVVKKQLRVDIRFHSFFRDFSQQALDQLCDAFTGSLFFKDEIIYDVKESAHQMFLIIEGTVKCETLFYMLNTNKWPKTNFEMFCEDDYREERTAARTMTTQQIYEKDMFFGEEEIILKQSRSSKATAESNCFLLSVSKHAFYDIFSFQDFNKFLRLRLNGPSKYTKNLDDLEQERSQKQTRGSIVSALNSLYEPSQSPLRKQNVKQTILST